jgi:hypothetical protein
MADEVWAFPNKREYDRACRAIRAIERMEPRPKQGRRSRGGGGGRRVLDLFFAVVTEAIAECTGDTSEIIPGVGLAQMYETDPETGNKTPLLTIEEEPYEVDVRNYDPDKSYSVNVGIYLVEADEHGGTQYYEVISANCNPFDEP